MLSFPSGRTAEELVIDGAAGVAWIVKLGCIELHPHSVRSTDHDHPSRSRARKSSVWARMRVNLRDVARELRPPQETPDPDNDPTRSSRAESVDDVADKSRR
jgi:DNA primase